jgi:Flp pilus assembly protein TadD
MCRSSLVEYPAILALAALLAGCSLGPSSSPEEAQRLFRVADSLHFVGELASSIDTVVAAIEQAPDTVRYYAYLAALYVEHGQPWDGENVMVHLVENRPTVEAFYALGTYYIEADRGEDAFDAFSRAVDLDDTDPLGHLGLANAYLARRDVDSAKAAVRRAIHLDPEFPQARFALGEVLLIAYADSVDQAIDEMVTALSSDRIGPQLLIMARSSMMYAYMLTRSNMMKQSVRLATAASNALNASSLRAPTVRYDLACVFSLSGDADRALEELSAAVNDGYSNADWMEADSDLKPLHGDQRFDELVATARARLGGVR